MLVPYFVTSALFILFCLPLLLYSLFSFFFFFPYPAPSAIYTLSLHDALPICSQPFNFPRNVCDFVDDVRRLSNLDRKSTRLNSSHVAISYAVFCLKKKKNSRS